jgi:PleD family two-component response regulator
MAKKKTPNKEQHILVVEDDPNTADMLTSYFDSLGYQVSHAAWGEDALSLAKDHLPDLIVLDIHLPDIDGYEVCAQLRSQRRTERIPIIFLTERNERMDRIMGLELGATDYITKPFDVQELRYRIRNILQREDIDILLHPITGLPISKLVEEQLKKVSDTNQQSVLGLCLQGMENFGETYGFVTHDDVLRAVALIMKNTVTEFVEEEPFIGQLDPYKFVAIVPTDKRYLVMGRLHQRLNEALSFFYPHQDWETGVCKDGSPIPKMDFELNSLKGQELPETIKILKLRKALFELKQEQQP